MSNTVEKVKASFRYKILRLIWVKSGNVSRWAGSSMVRLIVEADNKEENMNG